MLKSGKELVTQSESLWDNRDGDMGGAIMAIVALVVVAILASALIPTAITSIVGVNTTTWGTGAIAMWGVIGIFVVLCVLLIFVGIAIKAVD